MRLLNGGNLLVQNNNNHPSVRRNFGEHLYQELFVSLLPYIIAILSQVFKIRPSNQKSELIQDAKWKRSSLQHSPSRLKSAQGSRSTQLFSEGKPIIKRLKIGNMVDKSCQLVQPVASFFIFSVNATSMKNLEVIKKKNIQKSKLSCCFNILNPGFKVSLMVSI